ncbi:TPA: UTP--glucose-1-phosphate uridylyltransferase GalU [bacterium]|jgi:UTP--glucose-1-phosphate uridylyltransferase|nr:UTP--glucose-1-phosphate uridylyltransferase GalU [bacterium]
MSQKVKKAVIPAAGLGTRFLPATKSLPKEMLPIIDIPTIQLIVEEAVKSGITDILIITNPYKHEMENHFDYNYELEHRLALSNKHDEVKLVRSIAEMANIHYVRQKEPRGLGHAILCAKAFVGNEPFAILLGDDVVVNKEGEPSTKQLINVFEEKGHSVLGVQKVPMEDVSKYGNITPKKYEGERLCLVESLVEKPSVEEAKSDLAVLGRYVLTSNIFNYLETQTPGKNNEIQLTDAICRLALDEEVYAYDFIGERYDVGDKFGFIKATIDFALERDDLKEKVKNYLRNLIE